jgi:hypothetical protein
MSNAHLPLIPRAVPHRRSPVLAALTVAILGVLAPSCSESSGPAASSLSRDQADALVAQFVEALAPVDPVATSDVHDRAFKRATKMREELSRAGREVGLAALRVFQSKPDAALDQQWPLLEVAAQNCPAELEPILTKLVTTYDGERGMGLATQAVRILAESSPQAAIALYEPMLRAPWEHKTKPAQEALVDGWARAAKKLGLKDGRILCDVLVDIRQPPDARYAAVNKLRDIGGERAKAALKEVLLEASSDGLLRRKAAQVLVEVAPGKETCEVLLHVSGHESDPAFLTFLGSMLDKHCPGM